ncbi:ATP-dependent Clp protease ATP-binding subunit CLPT1, chloroplastic [Vitis vinifera]|uniref:ATP-dependent Clp protease ATP-binding subunit CLPT1, chloroplastic n=1 Tax=Vitis vinifera TaxID=29760 RepID=A0A438EET7_VITVI|nr:ATP-dependent Clp protease ATP-binding subunit CLPT1, chloroplastic [Vitis vinifera]
MGILVVDRFKSRLEVAWLVILWKCSEGRGVVMIEKGLRLRAERPLLEDGYLGFEDNIRLTVCLKGMEFESTSIGFGQDNNGESMELLCLWKESDILDLYGEGSSSFKLKHVLLLCPVSCFSANRSEEGEITTSHLLLGIWAEEESAGHKILATLGFNDDKAKELAKSINKETDLSF